ncbi:hypothetical protein RHGRI_020968 [Rhododendron griersonianum]|uniref:Gag1-like clamp domain-containing protein n=1 Tax=Rhododendron griersonianum TaxID=479676 RepID=A0AAV6JM88_9ERIC|nr:hypothetical protein RHGRI_020968 [Rhododendron griersonianum]
MGWNCGSDVINTTLIALALDEESRSCLGCCATLPLSTAMDEPSKGLGIQGKSVNKPSYSEDFWSTSTCEMDNSAAQSQRSVSSMSTSNPLLDPHNSACSTSNRTEFVNHGKSKLRLLLWNQTRQQWTANKTSQNSAQVREPKLSWNASYENLLGTNKPFPQPIPLAEMVEFLVDIWELEGLYD